MKGNRRGKKIITAVVAVCLMAVLLPACDAGHSEKAAVAPVEKKAIGTEQKEITEKKKTDRIMMEETETVPETADTAVRETAAPPLAETGTWSTASREDVPSAGNLAMVKQPAANPVTEPQATSHTHSYAFAGTQAVEHPAVTEQVWVEDAPAWEEVIRPG